MADKEYVRVQDPETGHKFTVAVVYDERLKVLKEDAVDKRGRPLPPEHSAPKRKARQAPEPAPEATNEPKEAN